MTVERTGGCLCGAIRYRLTAEPRTSRVCWCHDCRHLASNGTVNALFATESVSITGSPSEYVRVADSGNAVRRRFCPTCGSHLFADSPGNPGAVVVRIGTLDDPSSIQPVANIWSASAPKWACLDPSIERIERQPPKPPPAAA